MVIIGSGRVGTALERLAREAGEPCTLITRTDGWDALDGPPGDPILVAVRADDVEAVIDRVPVYRRHDLVFIQNGMIGPLLKKKRLMATTRGLLFFAAHGADRAPEIGQTSSPFTGGHALNMVRFLVTIGIPSQVVPWPTFAGAELEKLVWNSAFGLLCQAHDCDVATVCDEHGDDLAALVEELRVVGRAALNVELPREWLLERVIAYSRTIPTVRASFKAWPWRNGWFVQTAERYGREMPTHDRLLAMVGGAPQG